MRFAYLLTSGALAFATPALAQTTAPAQTPVPAATPATPAAPATPGVSGTQAATPATPATPAAAPTPIPPTVGATVYGAAGTPVGTIKAMDSQYVTLATDKGEVRLPVAGVGPGLKGPVIGLTAEQLDAAVAQAKAAQAPARR